ncbi:MAG: penicillin-binding protein 2 [Methylophilaceae bacterium]|jgi:penicillin-binding protein 2|nr:penicillin-binding protein 2 [Methylophilaceae bacterium]
MQRSQLKYTFQKRLGFITGLITILIFIIGLRFFYLQIFQYDFYKLKASNNSIRTIPIEPSRGIIFDRNGKVIADNRLIYNLELERGRTHNLDEIIQKLAPIIKVSSSDKELYQEILEANPFTDSIPVKTDLALDEVAAFSAKRFLFDEIQLKIRQKRYYHFNDITAHLVGHINRINKTDIEELQKNDLYKRYYASRHIGKTGIEKSYERLIHGFPGYKQIEVNAKNNVIQLLKTVPATDGDNINLTIDIELQKLAHESFGDKRGALVAIDVNNGEILTYVSQPGFDPNLFIDGINSKNWAALNNSKTKPMLDRVIHGLYPPGSTLKPFVGLSALENNIRKPPFTIDDPGYFNIGNKRFNDWKKTGHGTVGIIEAIKVSCDTFFYGLGLDLGVTQMNKDLSQYFFGRKTGIDMMNEKAGLLADAKWKKNKLNQSWFKGETAITAIGQGFTQVTPLQLAYATALIANPNLNQKPHLLLYSEKKELFNNEQTPPKVSLDNLKLIQEGMLQVTQEGGTAAFLGKGISYSMAAKTGTAQVFSLQGQEYDEESLPEHLKDHALFIAYAPAENPRVAVAVIVEHGGHGGSTAGPIAKKFFDNYMKQISY